METCISQLKSCSTKAQLLQFHAHLICTSLALNPAVSAALLSRIAVHALQDMHYARLVFAQIERPTTAHYNAMVRGYSQSRWPEKALCLYKRMRSTAGARPGPATTSFALKTCARMSYLTGGEQIHGLVMRDGHSSDSLLMTTLMDLYASCRRVDDAERLFDEIPVRDVVAWNVLLSAYVQCAARTWDALRLFDRMQEPPQSVRPDDVTCLLALQACSLLNALEIGEKIHRFIDGHGLGGALNLQNSLITMYSKCGSIDKAFIVFRDTRTKNVVSWTAIISGLAMNGFEKDALEAFAEMQRAGISPNEQTFTGLLSACSHGGMTSEAFDFLHLMKNEYGLAPNVHHYGCVIDLMGRAGLLSEAYDFILSSMTVQPDPTIWRTLLGACRVHKNFDLGEPIMKHLVELKAEEAGDYILLLNICSSVGNWEKVAHIRKLMHDRGIQSSRGCSTIVVSGVVHHFRSDDSSHPRKHEIYKMLEGIVKQLKKAGYVADAEAELHDLGVEAKEIALSFHNEKLAIAFGVLASPSSETIRIANKIRTCTDCHTFAKYVSSVYGRRISIRERNYFHHFSEGRCSCNDYW